jgi:hypothetical protein
MMLRMLRGRQPRLTLRGRNDEEEIRRITNPVSPSEADALGGQAELLLLRDGDVFDL